MIVLLQVLSLLTPEQVDEFAELFEYAEEDIYEMGYLDFETDYIYDALRNHFDIDLQSVAQLKSLTDCILSGKFKSGITAHKLLKSA